MTCQERSGFLFAHPCDRPSAWKCHSCMRDICDSHIRHIDEIPWCVSCLKKQNVTPPGPRGAQTQGYYSYDDPYWYAGLYLAGYSFYDADDYRAFDAPGRASVGGDFERDPGGS